MVVFIFHTTEKKALLGSPVKDKEGAKNRQKPTDCRNF